jgi:ankyrin repeat protein
MLEAIVPQHREEAINALRWLICSKRVMTVAELAEAVVIDLEDDGDVDISERLFDSSHIISVLSGLVITSDGSVRLAHFSVEEYLTSDRLARSSISEFWVSIPACQNKLLRACLRYLQTPSIEHESRLAIEEFPSNWSEKRWRDEQRARLSPLAEHAARLWTHYYTGRVGDMADNTIPVIISFLKSEVAMEFWKTLFYPRFGFMYSHETMACRFREDPWGDDVSDAIYYAARFGLDQVVQTLLTDYSRLPEPLRRRSYADALRGACFFAHAGSAKLLLDAGADPTMENFDHNTALRTTLASINLGRPALEVVLVLLDKVKLERDGVTASLLRWAISARQVLVAELIANQLDSDGTDDYAWYRRPVYWSRLAFHSPYHSYSYSGTPCYDAVRAGSSQLLNLFLRSWADIDERDHEGRTALYWATFQGNENIVKTLLDRGANPNVKVRGYGWTAIQWATDLGHYNIRLLLEQASEWAS